MTRYDDGTLLSSAASALDEKESLRPDDSASLKAVEDEDVHNYPAFGTGHGQTVFANIAPPFQDQLNEISVAGAASTPTRGLPLWQPTNDQGNDATYPTPTPFVLNRQLLGAVDGNSLYGSSMALPGPDQKLVDALESLRDRVFVLKLEENIISFITGSR